MAYDSCLRVSGATGSWLWSSLWSQTLPAKYLSFVTLALMLFLVDLAEELVPVVTG